MTYSPNVQDGWLSGLWHDPQQYWGYHGEIYHDGFNTADGSYPVLSTTSRYYIPTGSISNGYYRWYIGPMQDVNFYRPTTFTNSGCTFTSGSGPEAYDTDVNSYCQFRRTSTTSGLSSILFTGWSGTHTGHFTIKYRLIGGYQYTDPNEAISTAQINYTLDGTNWTSCASAIGTADTGVQSFIIYNLTNQNLANLKVSVEVEVQRLTLPVTVASSTAIVYDINFFGS